MLNFTFKLKSNYGIHAKYLNTLSRNTELYPETKVKICCPCMKKMLTAEMDFSLISTWISIFIPRISIFRQTRHSTYMTCRRKNFKTFLHRHKRQTDEWVFMKKWIEKQFFLHCANIQIIGTKWTEQQQNVQHDLPTELVMRYSVCNSHNSTSQANCRACCKCHNTTLTSKAH